MKLRYPLSGDMVYWNARKYPNIQHSATHSSPYYLIGLADTGLDAYIAFTNYAQDEIWIEKSSKLMGASGMYASGFQKIETDEEFNTVHRFFINEGILDGLKNTESNT